MRSTIAIALLAVALDGAPGFAAGPPAPSRTRLEDRFPRQRQDGIVFQVEAADESSVFLVGDFNDWNPRATSMQRNARGVWEATVPLPPGEHTYRFVIDGRQVLDPSNPDETRREDGSVSSRIRVLNDGGVSERHLWPRPKRAHRTMGGEWMHGGWTTNAALSFNRVDGATVWVEPSYRTEAEWVPELRTAIGYGWAIERLTVEADIAQPVTRGRGLFLGLRFVDGTGFDNQAEIGRGENTLAAVFLKHDFNDYWEITGLEPYVRLHLPAHVTLRASYASEDYSSLSTQTQWSLFTARVDDFRPNPPLFLLSDPKGRGGEGHLDAGRFEATLDSRRARAVGTVGFYAQSFVEWGAGDFDYVNAGLDGRAYLRLGSPAHLALRARGARRLNGDAIPSQKLFYLGGLGTVRGHGFRSQFGDREMLGNVEYTMLIEPLDGGVLAFYDLGSAWDSTHQDFQDTTFLQSVGFGFKSADDDFQINFAKPFGAVQGGIETTVRLNRTF